MNRSDSLRQGAALGLVAAAVPHTAQGAADADVPVAPLVPPHGGVNIRLLTLRRPTSSSFRRRPSNRCDQTMARRDGAPCGCDHVGVYRCARLGASGLLDGKTATTHHSAFGTLPQMYPTVRVFRGVRFVDHGRIATPAGRSAGMDPALHVVARYYGKPAAQQTAYDMEYQRTRWLDAGNAAYVKPPAAKEEAPYFTVCLMQVDPTSSLVLSYEGKKYRFCMLAHERIFASAPERFINA